MDKYELNRLKESIENGKFFRLDYLKIKVNDHCNLKCKGCDFWKITEKNVLEFNIIKKIVEEGISLGLNTVHISGGEPTLRGDLEEIISFITSKSIKVRMVTNGFALTKDRLVGLLERKLSAVTFSLDSADPQQNDYLRGVAGAWKRTVENIKSAHQLKSKFNFQLGINCVVSQTNIESLDKIVALAYELGSDWVRLDPFDQFQYILHGIKNRRVPIFSVRELKKYNTVMKPRLQKIHEETGQVIFPETLNLFGETDAELRFSSKAQYSRSYYSTKICFSPFTHLTVYPDGSVMPCCKIPLKFGVVGNIKEDSINNLVENEMTKRYIELVKKGGLNVCFGCTMKNFDNDQIYNKLSKINYTPKVEKNG